MLEWLTKYKINYMFVFYYKLLCTINTNKIKIHTYRIKQFIINRISTTIMNCYARKKNVLILILLTTRKNKKKNNNNNNFNKKKQSS